MIELVREKLGEIRELCERFHVRRLEVFGSAADGRYEEGRSDLDFIVDFTELPPFEHGDAYFALLFALEEMFGRGVDLVELQPPGRANPYFLKVIEESRELIYERRDQEAPVGHPAGV